MEGESTPVVPANRLLEVAGVLSEGASRLHEQLQHLPPAERQALLDAVVGQVGDIVRAWSELVRAVVSVDGAPPRGSRAATGTPVRSDDQPSRRRPDRAAPADSGAGEEGGASPSAQPDGSPPLAAYQPPAARDTAPGADDTLTRDELTGVLNRQAGWTALGREVERARSSGVRFVLGYSNVDGLRQVNDNDGPRAGDELLRKVAAALRATLRSYDVILRLAGDEFLFALPGADMATAEQRLREFNVILGEEAPGASVSVGFAELHEGESLDELVVRADDALVQTRRQRGRPRLR